MPFFPSLLLLPPSYFKIFSSTNCSQTPQCMFFPLSERPNFFFTSFCSSRSIGTDYGICNQDQLWSLPRHLIITSFMAQWNKQFHRKESIWEVSVCSASSRNPNVLLNVHRSPPLVPILSQINPTWNKVINWPITGM
jgi:hypothetical protein